MIDAKLTLWIGSLYTVLFPLVVLTKGIFVTRDEKTCSKLIKSCRFLSNLTHNHGYKINLTNQIKFELDPIKFFSLKAYIFKVLCIDGMISDSLYFELNT